MKNEKEYRDAIKKLVDRTLFSYPFLSKSDDELIFDSINRAETKMIEFGLFRLGEKDSKGVPVDDGVVETVFFPLLSLQDEMNTKLIEIKASSFCYPSYFFSSIVDKLNSARSTFNYRTYSNYGELFNAMEKYYGERVLVTTCWDTVTIFIQGTKYVNIIPTPKDNLSVAKLIRESFAKERLRFIKDFLGNPKKYMPFYPVEEQILAKIFEEFKEDFEVELNAMQKYESGV